MGWRLRKATAEMTPRYPTRLWLKRLAAVVLLPMPLWAQVGVQPKPASRPLPPRLSEEKSGSLAVRDGQRLRLVTDIGNIRIRTQNTGQLSYRVRVEADPREPDARKYLSQFVLSARSTPDGVQIIARVPWREFRGRLWVSFEVITPRHFHLDVTTHAGNITTESIDGRVSLVTAGGNLTAGHVGGSARLETQGGHVTVQDVAGDLTASSLGGHITVGKVQGEAQVHTGGGHIRVASVGGLARLETGGGNISVQRAGANVVATTQGGRIDLGETSGSIRARTGGGSIGILRVIGPTDLETAGGSICLTKVQGSVRASTFNGTITAWFIPDGKLQGPSQLESTSGDIVVFLPRELALTIDATIEAPHEHRIDADPAIPLKLSYAGSSSANRVLRAEGSLNGGGEILRLKTGTGDIRLRFSDATPWEASSGYEIARRQIEKNLWVQQEIIERESERLQKLQEELIERKQREHRREVSRMVDWQRKLSGFFSGRIRVDYAEQKQRLVSSLQPAYPSLARLQHIEGPVRLEVEISREGGVESVKVLSGHPLLAPAAEAAVRQWRFLPYALDGKPFPVVTIIDVAFRLN